MNRRALLPVVLLVVLVAVLVAVALAYSGRPAIPMDPGTPSTVTTIGGTR